MGEHLFLEACAHIGQGHAGERPDPLAAAQRQDEMVDRARARKQAGQARRIRRVQDLRMDVAGQPGARRLQLFAVAGGDGHLVTLGEKPARRGQADA